MTKKGKQSRSTVTIATLILSGIIAGVVAGPIFLYAQNPPTSLEEIEALNDSFYPVQPGNETDVPADPDSAGGYDPSTGFNQGPSPFDETPIEGGAYGPGPHSDEARAAAAQAAAETARKNQAKELADAFSCGFFNIKGCVAALMDMAMWLAARTLWIAGVLLNLTLSYTLNLNTLLESLPIVDIGWKVLRDIANIVFIFITLWCGISITLGLGGGGKKAWGYLAQMVLVALFINFSLFITKAVVDASNIAALHFYSLIVEPGKEKDFDSGLSEAFLYGLQLSTIFNAKQIGSQQINADSSTIATAARSANLKDGLSFTNIILIGFFGSLFIIVAAWVFFAAAIMFIYRAITLMMLMILSPLAFVGLILPGASGMAHAWWSKLWSQAFFAPLYLALAYIVVATINSGAFLGAYGDSATVGEKIGFAAAITGTGSNTIIVVFNFVMLIGFMVACLVVAQSLGAKGSEMAMAGWQKIKGAAVGGVVGVTGAAARGIIKIPSGAMGGVGKIGKAAQWMASTRLLKQSQLGKKMNEWGGRFQEGKGVGAKFAQTVGKAGKWFDPRYLEERAGQSKLGSTMIGRAVRGVTTGAVANLKIGHKSLEEAYQEGEEMASKRQEIEHGHAARENAKALEPFHEQEQRLLNEKLQAEEAEKGAGELDAAIRELRAKESGAADPAEKAKFKKEREEAEQQHQALEGAAAKIQTERLMEMDKSITEQDKTVKELTTKESAAALGSAEKEKFKKEREEAEKRRDETKKEHATLGSATALAAAKIVADKKVAEFTDKNGKEMQAHGAEINYALGQMSTEAFLNLPKTFFENPAFMDHTVLGQDKYLALMKSEHFTKEEKEEYTRARWKRAEDTAERRKVRNDQYLAELPEHQKKVDVQKTAREEVETDLQSYIESYIGSSGLKLKDDIKKADFAVAQAERVVKQVQKTVDEETDWSKRVLAEKALAIAEKDLTTKKGAQTTLVEKVKKERKELEKTKADTKGNQVLRTKSGEEIVHAPPKQPGWDEAPDVKKALRNILKPDEVTALYRYNRKAFSNPFIVDTIKQDTWNMVRNTGEIDSNSMEQARVVKRHYVQHAGDFNLGLDTRLIQKLGEMAPAAAKEIREEFHKQLLAVGPEDYFEHFDETAETWTDKLGRTWKSLGNILRETLKQHNLNDDVSKEERKLRHRAGETMYGNVKLNLANDEFTMMPGILRNMLIVRRNLSQATAQDYDKRDLDDTLPHLETWIEEFKRAQLGKGEINKGTLEIIKWVVNENRGHAFTDHGSIRDDLKPWFEVIKGYVATTGRAMKPIYESQQEVISSLQELKKKEGVNTPARNIFAEAGIRGRLFE